MERVNRGQMALDGLNDAHLQVARIKRMRGIPVGVVPFLQGSHIVAVQAHVQLHVLMETGVGEVGGADEGARPISRLLRIGDVALGVELVRVVDPNFDLPAFDGFDDGVHAGQELVLALQCGEIGV